MSIFDWANMVLVGNESPEKETATLFQIFDESGKTNKLIEEVMILSQVK